jgi:hypothetical protein
MIRSQSHSHGSRGEIEAAVCEMIKSRRHIRALTVPEPAAAMAKERGLDLFLFSAPHSAKVGSAVLCSKETVLHAFTTGALAMDDNFDTLEPDDAGFSSTENFSFGLCKGYLELYNLKRLMDTDEHFNAYAEYNRNKDWIDAKGKTLIFVEADKEAFLKHVMIEAAKKAVGECILLRDKEGVEGDPLMISLLPSMIHTVDEMTKSASYKRAEQVLDDYARFKKSFFLDNITKLAPKTAKMAVGRSVIYSAIVEDWEWVSTYAVEVTRTHFLLHHPEIAYTFFMINSGGVGSGGKEYSKYDDHWAQKYTKIATRGGGVLCDIASQEPEECLGFVIDTICDTSKLLAQANARVVLSLLHRSHSLHYIRAMELLVACGWEDAINKAIDGGNVFHPPKLPDAYASCIASATLHDRRSFIVRLSRALAS